MHEISVLQKVLDLCRRVAKENGANNIKEINISIGELSGMIPYFFKEYFPLFTKDDALFKGTSLNIKEIRGEALCSKCHSLYNVMSKEGICPKCGSKEKVIIGGQDFRVDQITLNIDN